jgi:hypothetical protein
VASRPSVWTGYWREFHSAVFGHPSDLWKALMAKPGGTPVDMTV